jgi:hypothetical protein
VNQRSQARADGPALRERNWSDCPGSVAQIGLLPYFNSSLSSAGFAPLKAQPQVAWDF